MRLARLVVSVGISTGSGGGQQERRSGSPPGRRGGPMPAALFPCGGTALSSPRQRASRRPNKLPTERPAPALRPARPSPSPLTPPRPAAPASASPPAPAPPPAPSPAAPSPAPPSPARREGSGGASSSASCDAAAGAGAWEALGVGSPVCTPLRRARREPPPSAPSPRAPARAGGWEMWRRRVGRGRVVGAEAARQQAAGRKEGASGASSSSRRGAARLCELRAEHLSRLPLHLRGQPKVAPEPREGDGAPGESTSAGAVGSLTGRAGTGCPCAPGPCSCA